MKRLFSVLAWGFRTLVLVVHSYLCRDMDGMSGKFAPFPRAESFDGRPVDFVGALTGRCVLGSALSHAIRQQGSGAADPTAVDMSRG